MLVSSDIISELVKDFTLAVAALPATIKGSCRGRAATSHTGPKKTTIAPNNGLIVKAEREKNLRRGYDPKGLIRVSNSAIVLFRHCFPVPSTMTGTGAQ
jgi:hypothetical protein